MDNGMVYLPRDAFLKWIKKTLILDSVVYLFKLGWGFYIAIADLEKMRHEESRKELYKEIVYTVLGGLVILFVLLRYIANFATYKDTSSTLLSGEQRVSSYSCIQCWSWSKTWVFFALTNMTMTLVVDILCHFDILWPWFGVTFLIWEIVVLLLISFFKLIVYRSFHSSSSPTTNLISSD